MEHKTRYSKKREAILSLLQSTTVHPSAEWVYNTLKPNHPDLSLGTVYRNLLFFQENGMAQSVGVVKGHERFDGTTTPHSHFVCRSCGDVQDLMDISLSPDLDRQVGTQHGLTVDRHQLTFYGTCQNCMQK